MDSEKLRHLLRHWIEHEREHVKKYHEWAQKLKNENPEVSELLNEAIKKFKEGETLLEEAYKRLD